MLSNSGHDENGRFWDGIAGDQNGREWSIVDWYDYPLCGWDCILRHPDPVVRRHIKNLAIEAAYNDNIGYDQHERFTFLTELRKAGYHPANISVPCESDCSAGMLAIVMAVGYILGNIDLMNVSPYGFTGNAIQILTGAGFVVLNGDKYLTSDEYLIDGDILLNIDNHTCICVGDGVIEEDDTGYRIATENIQFGSCGACEYRLQIILKARGYYDGELDWIYGAGTAKGLHDWLADEGMVGSGKEVTRLIWDRLLGLRREGNNCIIREVGLGERDSESVLLWEEFLKCKGYYHGELDWCYGMELDAAARQFSLDKGIEYDGTLTAEHCAKAFF